MSCKTCETVAFLKKDYEESGRKTTVELRSCIEEDIGKSGVCLHKGMDLKFCPECGRKFKPSEVKFNVGKK